MEPVTTVLGGITVAVIAGVLGKSLSDKNKVKDNTCSERRIACVGIVITKIDNLTKVVDKLEKAVNNKLLSL